MKRPISDPSLNLLYQHGAIDHKKTNIAPQSLLKQSVEDNNKFLDSYNSLLSQLSQAIGTPYFSESGFILYNLSTEEFLNLLAKNTSCKFNLIITSPPYNIGKEYEQKVSVTEYIDWCASWMNYIYDTTCENGTFWLNLGYFDVPHKGKCVPISYLLWDKSKFYLQQEIVWAYEAGVTAKKRLAPRNEKWLFYTKQPEGYVFNLDAIRDPNVKYPNQKKNGKFRCNPLGKNPGDVWQIPKITTGKDRSSRERTGHPAQFPLAVVERIIKVSSNFSDVIYDPFAGSCSTGIAAIALGRCFVGTEINKRYCDISVERFRAYQKEIQNQQPTLF